jgi:hypothetical protein
MPYEMAVHGQVVFVVWGKPEASDISRVVAEIEHVASKTGRQVVFVTRVPAGAEPPDENVRGAAAAKLGYALQRCSGFHVVMEGSGFTNTIKRSVFATISMLARTTRGKVHVHAEVKDVVSRVAPDIRAEVSASLRVIAARGLLSVDRPIPGTVEVERRAV